MLAILAPFPQTKPNLSRFLGSGNIRRFCQKKNHKCVERKRCERKTEPRLKETIQHKRKTMLQVSRDFVECVPHEEIMAEHRKRRRRLKTLSGGRFNKVTSPFNLTTLLLVTLNVVAVGVGVVEAKECNVNIGDLIV